MYRDGAGYSPEFDDRERVRIDPSLLNQARYRALLQSICTFVWIAGPDGDFTFPQDSWEAYTGQDFSRHGGDGWIEAVHPDDRAHVARTWTEALASCSWYEVECRCWHGRSAAWRRCRTRAVPILNDRGEVYEWLGAVSDLEGHPPDAPSCQPWSISRG